MKKNDRPKRKTATVSPADHQLEEQIKHLDREMNEALAKGEFGKASELAREQEKLLERLMEQP
jgi:hypothetical protein